MRNKEAHVIVIGTPAGKRTLRRHRFIWQEEKWSRYTPWGVCGERRHSSYSFLTSALERGQWSASRPGRALHPGKGPPVPTGPQWRSWRRGQRKNPLPLSEIIVPVVRSAVRHCSDWATWFSFIWEDNINLDFNKVEHEDLHWIICFGIGSRSALSWILQGAFVFHKTDGISWLAERLSASKQICFRMELNSPIFPEDLPCRTLAVSVRPFRSPHLRTGMQFADGSSDRWGKFTDTRQKAS
jgi:hypothetical protein